MSDARTSRLPLIALGCAIVAVVVAALAAVHTLTRPEIAVPSSALDERRVDASDVLKLVDGVDVVVEAGQPRGVRPRDPALASALGFTDDDVLVSLSGRTTLRERDLGELITRISQVEVRSLYAELQSPRSGPRVVRWILDGDLADARRDAQVPARPATPAVVPPALIEKIDATHYRMSRTLLDQLVAMPKLALAGARIAPGRSMGFSVVAVQPGSLFDRLGAAVGDTITAFNHEPVTGIDDVAAWFNNARRGSEITVDLVRIDGTPVTIHVAIR